VTTSEATVSGVTYTVVGGTATAAGASPGASADGTPPPGVPVSAVPTTGKTTVRAADAPQLWILGNAKGMAFTHFNCGYYPNSTDDKLAGYEEVGDPIPNPVDPAGRPRKDASGNAMTNAKSLGNRTLQSSGCGLFALSTILGGYEVIVPDWDPASNAFKSTATKGTVDMQTPKDEGQPYGPGRQPGSPRAFLHFLWHYIIANNSSKITTELRAKDDLSTKILAADPNGALHFADPLARAIEFMFTYHPLAYDAQGNYQSAPGFGITFQERVQGFWEGGTEISAVSNSIISLHQPVIIGVGPKSCWHQVVVIGVAKYQGKTYYIAIDSGFSGDSHPGPLLPSMAPLSWPSVVQYSISSNAGFSRRKIPNIFWYRMYAANDSLARAYDFTLYCKGVREW
jgi:hypothetical protein